MPYEVNKYENDVIDFWKKDNTFQKSIDQNSDNYIFYDGPPFATGLPHYGHILASVIKDVVARYWTMKGKRIERKWGWDCHGLPIENIVEKELGTKSKKDIEDMGVDKFNETCRSKVLSYVEEWEKTITRLGRWVDMENSYRTMDRDYMESIWWVFKELWDKDLIYKDYKSMHICPRCETTLSQYEVSDGYKDVKDLTVTAKFKLKPGQSIVGHEVDDNTYILAWTTTPWTLPGNVALAVGNDIEYVLFKIADDNNPTFKKGESYIVADGDEFRKVFGVYDPLDGSPAYGKGSLVSGSLGNVNIEYKREIKGKDLVGLEYEPLFPYYADTANAFRVVSADFVTTDDGTGVVHIAPAFGEDDMKLSKTENLPFIQHVTPDGRFVPEVTDFAGLYVKPIDDVMSTDIEIIKYLAGVNGLFSKKKVEHSYPHCWRCDTPLLNYATDSWFVAVTKIKDQALKNAEKINWSPAHIKEGRFGKWLEGARDWSISRQRFWASVMPVWKCETCKGDNKYKVFGNVSDLEKASGEKINDLHKHIVDKIMIKCEHCGGDMHRIPDVLDTWFDSGSMPYAQKHYPFDNKDEFDSTFPADFIAEGIDQTRAWFYYLHIISTALRGENTFQNVIVDGIVVAEDGKKMSKKLQNYPDPNKLIDQYGADALRYYLMNSPVVQSENLAFSEAGVRESYNKVVNTLWNVLQMYKMFAGDDFVPKNDKLSTHPLDRWILAKLDELNAQVDAGMQNYKLNEAARPIVDFVTELSQWYVRRSRTRLKGDDAEDKNITLQTLHYVLENVSKIIAPITPFIAEVVYQGVTNKKDSVHLVDWLKVKDLISDQEEILESMAVVRGIVEKALAIRAESGIKTRQPLASLSVPEDLDDAMIEILKDEVNVRTVITKADSLELDINLTDELKQEGIIRELTRHINSLRKQAKLTINDKVVLSLVADDELVKTALESYKDELKKATLSIDIIQDIDNSSHSQEVNINDKKVVIGIKVVK